jgi:hypothetical protein
MNKKFDFTIKVLEKQLIAEKHQLKLWESILLKEDVNNSHRQANGNIPNNKNRISELENALEYLKI